MRLKNRCSFIAILCAVGSKEIVHNASVHSRATSAIAPQLFGRSDVIRKVAAPRPPVATDTIMALHPHPSPPRRDAQRAVPGAIRRRAAWLRHRLAAGRYPLLPDLVASEIMATDVCATAAPTASTESQRALAAAIAALTPEAILILQAVFVDHRAADELALALDRTEQEIWTTRRLALLGVRAALLATLRGGAR